MICHSRDLLLCHCNQSVLRLHRSPRRIVEGAGFTKNGVQALHQTGEDVAHVRRCTLRDLPVDRAGLCLQQHVSEQVVHLVRVGFEVVKLVRLSHAVEADQLVAVAAHAEHGRGLGERALPEVLVEERVTPILHCPVEQPVERAAVHRLRNRYAGVTVVCI